VTGRVRVGISGWRYPAWRGDFYPKGLAQRRELEYAAEQLTSVEINGSFYSLQRPTSYAAWRATATAVREDFVFAVKGGRFVTHMKRMKDVEVPLANFFASGVLALGPALGPILWQLPENFKRDDARLSGVLERAPRDHRHAFEFRHPSWFAPRVYDILADHGAALVIADSPKWPFQARKLTTDWAYIRFHHGRRGHGGNYSNTELATWRRRMAAWRSRTEVFAYFNNDWEAYSVRNARRLAEGLSR
jgi:uncharacterized protein YecE (DUF72 family)